MIGLEGIEGKGDESSGWTDVFETEKGAVFIDLPLTKTVEHDLSALSSRPAQVKQLSTEKVKFELKKLWWSLGLGHP